MKINFLTTNSVKFNNAKLFFDALEDYELVGHSFDTPEIQHESCEEIARHSAVWAAGEIGEPCVKMDVGLFIPALGGFPGPFVKYVNDWLSAEQLLRLLEGESDRSAYFTDALAIGYPDGKSEVFTWKTSGRIADHPGNSLSKWPVDSIFIPDGYDEPIGEMSDELQDIVWGNGVWPKLVKHLSKK